MKSFIVDFKMDSELNSVSQNSPFFTHAEFRFELLLVRVTDSPLIVKTPEHTLFSLSHSTLLYFFNFGTSRAPLHLPHRAACPQDLFFWAQQAGESCKCIGSRPRELLLTAATWGSANLTICRTPSRLAPSSLQRKGATSFLLCRLSSNLLHSKNSFVQLWSPNLLLQLPAPSLQRLVMLNWA